MRYNIFVVALYVRLTMFWHRTEFFVTVTEGLLAEVSEKRKGCGRKAIPPVVARIFSGDSTSPLTSGRGKFSARRRDYCPFTMVVGMARFDAAIPQSCDR